MVLKNKINMKFLLKLTPILLLAVNLFAQNASSTIISTQENLEESFKTVPCKSEERLEAVKNLFLKMGAKPEDVITEKFNKDKIANITVTKKGKTEETIIVGAHYDKVSEGCGAVDNWTGITIIAHLYKTLSKIDTQKTYIFVAFDQEEKGLLGSDAMAKAIPKEKRTQYCSMVNFDSFGFTSPFILRNLSSPKMIEFAEKVAKESGFKMVDVEIPGAGADSSSFKNRDIPAVTFSGLDKDWQNIIHTSNDKTEKIKPAGVYFGYRFGLSFLANLDANVCREAKK
jgi:Zn-dependent M28 family amino/carboxypeptidase